MAFTDAEKTDIRRFCGYPAYGAAPIGIQTWRFYQAYALMEFRINNLSDPEENVARHYLGALTIMETAISRAGDNLDTDQAAVWTRNSNEVVDRTKLFDDWRRRLCGFFGIPGGPSLANPGITIVV